MRSRPHKTLVIAIAVTVLVAVAGYGLYRGYQKRMVHNNVVAWLLDAGKRLQTALSQAPGASVSADELAVIQSLDAHVDAVARNLAALRELNAAGQRPLVDDTDHFLLAVREILRQHAASRRHRHFTAVGLQELWAHMGSRYAQGAGWSTEAVRRKDLLEREYFHYRNTTDALTRLLESYPELRTRVAPLVDARHLPDENFTRAASERAAEAVRRMALDMDKLRKLPRP
jgi:hypothetical protein